jgi:hypothetical protein
METPMPVDRSQDAESLREAILVLHPKSALRWLIYHRIPHYQQRLVVQQVIQSAPDLDARVRASILTVWITTWAPAFG